MLEAPRHVDCGCTFSPPQLFRIQSHVVDAVTVAVTDGVTVTETVALGDTVAVTVTVEVGETVTEAETEGEATTIESEPAQAWLLTAASIVTSAKKTHEGGLVAGFQVNALHCEGPGAQHCGTPAGHCVVVRVHGWLYVAAAWQTWLLVWNCVQQEAKSGKALALPP